MQFLDILDQDDIALAHIGNTFIAMAPTPPPQARSSLLKAKAVLPRHLLLQGDPGIGKLLPCGPYRALLCQVAKILPHPIAYPKGLAACPPPSGIASLGGC